jgi:hypothetical protein
MHGSKLDPSTATPQQLLYGWLLVTKGKHAGLSGSASMLCYKPTVAVPL